MCCPPCRFDPGLLCASSRSETHYAFKFSFWSTSQHDSTDFAGISFGSASNILWKNTEEAYSSSLTMLPRYFQYVGKTEEGWRRNPRQQILQFLASLVAQHHYHRWLFEVSLNAGNTRWHPLLQAVANIQAFFKANWMCSWRNDDGNEDITNVNISFSKVISALFMIGEIHKAA